MININSKIVFQSLILFVSADLFSQDIPNIITDRPDITESSFTVPKKHFQIESGFSYSKNRYEIEYVSFDTSVTTQFTDEYIATPSVLFRLGVTDGIELRLGGQILTTKSTSEDFQENAITKTELVGITLAAKFKLTEQDKVLPSIAVIAGSSFPALNPGSQTDVFDPAVTFALSNQITDNFGAGYNIGFNLQDGINSSASGAYSINVGLSPVKNVGMFAEVYGFIPFSSNKSTNYIDAGFTFLTQNNIQLDLSGGYGLNSSITEYFISTGFSIRLPN